MSTTHNKIASHLAQMHDSARLLQTEIELIDGSDPRDRERRGSMRTSIAMIQHLISGLSASAGYLTVQAYAPPD